MGACLHMGHLFFSPHVHTSDCNVLCHDGRAEIGRKHRFAAAKALCRTCKVQDVCLQYAMDTLEQEGIYGGLTETDRADLRKLGRRYGKTWREIYNEQREESRGYES